MNCPYCGAEMKKGEARCWARGGGILYFMPDGAKKLMLISPQNIKKRGGVMLPDTAEDFWSMSFYNWPEAYACETCRRIEIKY